MSKCPNGYGGHALDTTTIRAMRVCVFQPLVDRGNCSSIIVVITTG